jgi:hypothetical protein
VVPKANVDVECDSTGRDVPPHQHLDVSVRLLVSAKPDSSQEWEKTAALGG